MISIEFFNELFGHMKKSGGFPWLNFGDYADWN
jgi:hypothetical protein